MTVVETETRTVAEPTVRDVLHRAADLIGEFDWRQAARGSKEEGRLCLVGAIDAARIDFGIAIPKYENVYDFAGRLLREENPQDWNDEPGRMKAEVVAKLREAAEASS